MELEKFCKPKMIREKIDSLEIVIKNLENPNWNDAWLKIEAWNCNISTHTLNPIPIYLNNKDSKITDLIREIAEKELNKLKNEFDTL